MQVQIIQKIRFNFGACQKQYDKRIRQKSKLKKSNEHFVHQISSFLIFAMLLVIVMIYSDFLVEMVLHLFGGDFSSGIFFVEIFLQIFLGRQMSLKRLFGRNDFFCLQNVSSELPWYYFVREILVRNCLKGFGGEISLQIIFS